MPRGIPCWRRTPRSTGARNGRFLPGYAPAGRSPRPSASFSFASASRPASSTPSRRVCAARSRRFKHAGLRLIKTLERRIERARQVLATMPEGTSAYHQKQRRLGALQQRLTALKEEEAVGTVRLCFGSRPLFRRQFALAANGYASHDAWRRAWRAARSSQFFVLGSKDETAGCQGCVATVEPDGTITLRLRLPNACASRGKHVVLAGLRFRYGHQAVVAALGRNLSPDKTTLGSPLLAVCARPQGMARAGHGVGARRHDAERGAPRRGRRGSQRGSPRGDGRGPVRQSDRRLPRAVPDARQAPSPGARDPRRRGGPSGHVCLSPAEADRRGTAAVRREEGGTGAARRPLRPHAVWLRLRGVPRDPRSALL